MISPRLQEHLICLALVTVLGVAGLTAFRVVGAKAQRSEHTALQSTLLTEHFVSVADPFHRALISDLGDLFFSDEPQARHNLSLALQNVSEQSLYKKLDETHTAQKLSFSKLRQIGWMYLKFVMVYAIVLMLTYYGVETLAAVRFAGRQKRFEIGKNANRNFVKKLLLSAAKTAGGFILFSPAYVIAYAIRTEFGTDAIIFMIMLASISNGLLITYANKFYAFLLAESRKGYVLTATVKNLHTSYAPIETEGVSLKALLHPMKRFDGHIFGHIFRNARKQYLPTIKEQAAFLITGLVIIEMALNIHGYLSYELLRQLLFRNYDIVMIILLAIFFTVKITDIVTDGIGERNARRYENRT